MLASALMPKLAARYLRNTRNHTRAPLVALLNGTRRIQIKCPARDFKLTSYSMCFTHQPITLLHLTCPIWRGQLPSL
jgi:hypothetical protein